MLKPLEMSKIIVAGPDTEMEKTIKALHKMRIMHIVDHKKNDVDIGMPLEKANKFAEILVKIRSLISYLEINQEPNKSKLNELRKQKISLSKLEKDMARIETETKANLEELKNTENNIKNKQELANKLELLKPIGLDIDSYTGYRTLSSFAGHIQNIGNFLNELEKITTKYSLKKYITNKKSFIVLFVETSKAKEAQDLLNKHAFAPLDISFLQELKGDINKNILKMNDELISLEKRKNKLKKSLQQIKNENSEILLLNEALLKEELEKAEAPLRFAKTKNSFIINGWLPTKNVEKATEILEKLAKKKIFIQTREMEEKDKIPVKLDNPDIVKPFEFFMDLYALPKYKEIDPTFFLFLTFPLLFGFMLGDIGYGLTTLIIFWLLKKAMPKAKDLLDIMIFASLATIFFGALFGEFFGFEVLFGYELPHILNRAHQIITLLYIAVAVGIIHVNWGLLNGFYNVLKHHGLFKAICEKLSWIMLEAGVALIALYYLKILALKPYYGYGILLLSIILLYLGEGVKGLIELPSIFTNILSYARLMAIGLASVELAIVINEFALKFISSATIIGVISAVLILVLGHTINIGVGVLGSFLHSLRLHYVEFFTKFFEGGAIRYKPFGVTYQ